MHSGGADAVAGAQGASGAPRGYLLLDLDGTLLDGQARLSLRNRAALKRAVAAGLALVLASGRTYPSLMRICGDLELPFHLITNGGAVGLTPGLGAVRHTSFLDAALWPRVVEGLQAEGLSVLVFQHRHPELPLFHVTAPTGDPHFEAYVTRNRHLCRVAPHLAAAPVPDVVEVAALGRSAAFQAASERVLQRFTPETRCHSMVLHIGGEWGRITEFFAPATSKWQAFLGLFPEAAAHPERVIAFGDEANDVEMIRNAGLGIAMGNAVPAVRAVADRVTLSNEEDGVAAALEVLLG